MKLFHVQASAVVAGNAHNPTILNPDFMQAQGIVPAAWRWKVEETLTTPPLALVRYDNHVAVTVEQNKLQVADPNITNGPEKSKVFSIAQSYVEILPHVVYTAVGNNFHTLVPLDEPETYLRDRFVKAGPWSSAHGGLQGVSLNFSYTVNSARLNFKLEAGEATLPDSAEKQDIVAIVANFSRVIDAKKNRVEEVSAALGQAMADWMIYLEVIRSIFGEESN